MKVKVDAIAAYTLFGFIMAFFTIIVIRFPMGNIWITSEGLPGDWLRFYFYVIALFFSARLALAKSRYRFFFAVLGLACLYAAGEEISWGQRLLDIATPGFPSHQNLRQATNLRHFFTGPHGAVPQRAIEVLQAGAFIVYGVIFPLELRIGSRPAVWINRLGIPAPPLYLWPFFTASALLKLGIFTFTEPGLADIFLSPALAILTCHFWLRRQGRDKRSAVRPRHLGAAILLICVIGMGLAAATSLVSGKIVRLKAELHTWSREKPR
ncbi:MAG: hypothetical protein HY885_05925 [Deltaproteobacteria bacterium]|nr:hypothetical protein [Deltaproteobacteria bacterium]